MRRVLDLTGVSARLTTEYGHVVTHDVVVRSLQSAWDGVQLFGLDGDAATLALVERMARQEIELTAGLVDDRTYLDGRARRSHRAS